MAGTDWIEGDVGLPCRCLGRMIAAAHPDALLAGGGRLAASHPAETALALLRPIGVGAGDLEGEDSHRNIGIAAIAQPLLQRMVKEVADKSFNCVTVDGDTSTNDSFVLIATGKAETGDTRGKCAPP